MSKDTVNDGYEAKTLQELDSLLKTIYEANDHQKSAAPVIIHYRIGQLDATIAVQGSEIRYEGSDGRPSSLKIREVFEKYKEHGKLKDSAHDNVKPRAIETMNYITTGPVQAGVSFFGSSASQAPSEKETNTPTPNKSGS